MILIVEQYVWASPLLLSVALAHIPIMWYLAHRNSYTHNVLYSGWTPVIGAMVISRLVLLFCVFKWNCFNHKSAQYEKCRSSVRSRKGPAHKKTDHLPATLK